MKILIIGGGGREHALAWKLARSPQVSRVHTVPGNPGIAEESECLPIATSDSRALLEIAEQIDADLTVVGPEAPLVMGVADLFRTAGRRVIGPSAMAARLEGSKVFSKNFMVRHGIPTARAVTVAGPDEALSELGQFSFPVVLKYDGLAAGKGVILARNRSEAEEGLTALPSGQYVVEEFLTGEEVSFIALVHERGVVALEATQDHKAIFDDDQGPNTGGMGAYCDGRILNGQRSGDIVERVILPTVEGMRKDGVPFTGFLYAGLMMTAEGPKVLEFNVRLGDPEAQALLHRMDSDLLATLLEGAPPRWKPEPSVCVVMAAHGYPGKVRTGDLIHGIAECGATVFHAGTRKTERGLETAGGRVLGVTASGATLQTAIDNTYAAVRRIRFDGMQYRSDIGRKGLARWA